MLNKLFKKILRRKLTTGIILALIIVGGYFGYRGLTKNQDIIQYVTAEAERGTIVSIVSGSGQIDVSDQVDVKPEVSGKVVAVYVKEGQEVKEGDILAVFDSKSAERAVADAGVALESAKIKLEELLSQPDAQLLLQAENAFAQAERDLEKLKTREDIEADAEEILATAYEDGYSTVSSVFYKLADYMKVLRDAGGTEKNELAYVGLYELILGKDSLFIQKFINDYDEACDLYDENFTFFRKVYRDDKRDTVYQLISDTIKTTKAISQTFESARHMFDAIVAVSYKQLDIASHIDEMKSKMQSNISSTLSDASSLQKIIDAIDDTVEDTPNKIEDARLAMESAEEKLKEKEQSLNEVRDGADSLDIRAQENTVAQKELALVDAEEKLTKYFIRASFDGVITEVNVKIGDTISTGGTLAILMTRQQIANLTLNEIDIAKVKLNQPVILTFDAVEGLTLTGKVTDIAGAASISQGVVTYGVVITLDTTNDSIKQGMTTDVSIIIDKKTDVVFVPNSAIQSQGDNMSVRILEVETSELSAKVVEVGLSNDEVTEIVSGLQEGEKIVIATLGGESQTSSQTANIGTSFQIPGLGGNNRSDFHGAGFQIQR